MIVQINNLEKRKKRADIAFEVAFLKFLGFLRIFFKTSPAIFVAGSVSAGGIFRKLPLSVSLRIPFYSVLIAFLYATSFKVHVGKSAFGRTVPGFGSLSHVINGFREVLVHPFAGFK